ncbi:hypothetical protein [Nonomuraea bangladeshensis]|uniref:hypothetical protein n=1 Tax=Nonomuraea bangladeshensis TaxID=404385 RepID=UPI003C2B560A
MVISRRKAALRQSADARDAFLAVLEAAAPQRAHREERTAGLYGTVPGWVIDEAGQMLALVNRLRAASGQQPATLEQVLRIEESAHGSDYAAKYALRCVFLARGEDQTS